MVFMVKFDQINNKYGAYSKSGIWNNIIWIDNKPYRERLEALIFNYTGYVFLELKNNSKYRLPGGGVEQGIPNEKQLFEECKEEARIIIKNIKNTNITYTSIFESLPSWMVEEELPYYGQFVRVYTSEFEKKYMGNINTKNEDINMSTNGNFYPISYLTKKEHILAANLYLKNK